MREIYIISVEATLTINDSEPVEWFNDVFLNDDVNLVGLLQHEVFSVQEVLPQREKVLFKAGFVVDIKETPEEWLNNVLFMDNNFDELTDYEILNRKHFSASNLFKLMWRE